MMKRPLSALGVAIASLARRLRGDQRGNVILMTAFALVPLLLAVGFGVDYARAQRLQTKVNAAADAAALAAVDPSMISQSSAAAKLAAQNMFNQQVSGLPGLTVSTLTVTITDTSSGSLGTLRTAVVAWKGTSTNLFSGILKAPSLTIGGTTTASASQPPSINFYIALDVSPSMLLPTTSSGITNLNAGAIWKGESLYYPGNTHGCDFACHAVNMQQWNAGTYVLDNNGYPVYTNNGSNSGTVPFYRVTCSGTVYDSSGNTLGSNGTIVNSSKQSVPTYCNYSSSTNQYYSPTANPVYIYYLPSGKSNYASNYVTLSVNYPDTWWLAQNYDVVNPGQSQITLRTDAESDAAAGVITYAYAVEQQYATATTPPVYKMQFFTFAVGTPTALSTSPFGTMTDVATLQSKTFPDLGAQAPYLLQANCSGTNTWGWTTASVVTCNKDSDFNAMLSGMASILPSSSGTGTPTSPQNVLVIITDGMSDNLTDGVTQLTANNLTQCTAIKATGTRIAILYTQYLPGTINYTANTSFNTIASNNVPNVQSQLQSCASQNADGTYLMQTVSTDGSVSTALNTLFSMAVQSAKLIN